jgi:protease-4
MDKKRPLFLRILGWIWQLIAGLYRIAIVLSVVGFALLVWFAVHGGAPVPVKQNVALVIDPHGQLVDQENPAGRALLEQLGPGMAEQTSIGDLIEALDDAAADSRIASAVIDLDHMSSGGMPQIAEIDAAVQRFRATGKKVYAYGQSYDQMQYLLAASADQVSLDPLGQLVLTGFGVYTNYFKDALDKLGVTVNVFRVGEYKSAVEPFIRNDMSPDARAANQAWLQDLWSRYNGEVAALRKLQGRPADDYVNGFSAGLAKYQGDIAGYAKASGLVDNVETLAQFRKRVAAKVGIDQDTGSFRQIDYDDYVRTKRYEAPHKPPTRVAVIAVEGDIVDGEGGPGEAGGDSISHLIDKARQDDDVAALVLRVNSPGGSVTAAEKIQRALQQVQSAGTPVVVSMSTLAASGGYWISMGADEIWAHRSTITGSIGIFGLWPTIDKPLDKLGIHTDGVGTTPLAGTLRIDRPMTPALRELMQSTVDFGYRQFIAGVAKGRSLAPDRVEQIARGRVWSGEAAQKLGLVDKFGGLKDAIASAAQMANLKPGQYGIEQMSPERGWLQQLFGGVSGRAQLWNSVLGALQAQHTELLDRAVAVAARLRALNDPRGLYAFCACRPSGS